MIVYLFLLFYLFALRNNQKNIIRFLILSLFLLFFVCVFRGISVGTDTVSYLQIYNRYAREPVRLSVVFGGHEYLFSLIYHYLGRIGISYRIILMIQSALFLCPIGWVLFKQGGRPIEKLLFLFLLGFYFGSFNIVRQSIAISFAFLGYYFIENKKYFSFVISFFIAWGFHLTSLLILVVIILKYINLNKYWVILLIVVSYSIPLIFDMSFLSAFFISEVNELEAYTRYIEREGVMKGGAIPVTGTIISLLYVYIVYIYGDENRKRDFFYKISVFSVILTNLLFVSPTWTVRIIMYFSVAQVTFLSRLSKRSVFDRTIVYGYALVYFIYYYILQNYNEVKPYVFDMSFNV